MRIFHGTSIVRAKRRPLFKLLWRCCYVRLAGECAVEHTRPNAICLNNTKMREETSPCKQVVSKPLTPQRPIKYATLSDFITNCRNLRPCTTQRISPSLRTWVYFNNPLTKQTGENSLTRPRFSPTIRKPQKLRK